MNDERAYGGRAKLLAFSAAQGVWVELRGALRRLLGQKGLDRLMDATGLRAWKARHWLSQATLPDGARVLYRPHDQCFIDEVYSMRVYDQGDVIRPGQTVVDIGGHIGLFSLYAAHKVGAQGRVVVCEPGPNNFPLLKENVERNRRSQISAHPFAISDKEGEADFYIPEGGADEDNPATNSLFARTGRKAVKVPLRTLDWLVKNQGIERIDHLKIDVEGAELSVMLGGEAALRMARRVVMEVHPPLVAPETVHAWLKERGFEVRDISTQPPIVEGIRP